MTKKCFTEVTFDDLEVDDVVLIEWQDAFHQQGWKSEEEMEEVFNDVVKEYNITVGIVFAKDEDHLGVIQSVGFDTVDALMILPRPIIVRIVKLTTIGEFVDEFLD